MAKAAEASQENSTQEESSNTTLENESLDSKAVTLAYHKINNI